MANQTQQKAKLYPTIISTADLSTYLVGAEDIQGNFYNIYSTDKSMALAIPSLEQAKDFLRHQGVKEVTLKLQTPYDEMIGMQSCGPVRMKVLL